MHDFFAACPTGAFFDFGSSTPCLRRALSIDCITTNCDKRRYVHKLYRVARSTVQIQAGGLPRRVRDYIALSRRSEEILRPYLPPDAHVHLLENPVGVPKSPPVKVGENDAMVVVGRLDPEKGIHVLLAAARRTGTRLTLIGDGPLRQIAEASGLCRVTGWLPREAVLAELESARCLVFPSLWYETYGLAVAEAAARGIPAIVSDISAAAERVRDGVDGWHARAGSVDDLERCLHIASDNAAVQVTGREAYARYWSDPPTRENHAVRLIKVYASVLGRVEHE
jgi:glycosyltransferase involved in cell wall biosynthesis